MEIEEFIERVTQRAMPKNALGRIKTLARELAEGASEGVWLPAFDTQRGSHSSTGRYGRWFSDYVFQRYVEARWQNDYPSLDLLLSNGYLEMQGTSSVKLVFRAFNLIEEVEAARIFISYKRSESSAFALLINRELKTAGLQPFLDMALTPGENWEDGLRQRIQQSEYLVVLLGQQTLTSQVTLKELVWAAEAGVVIIPVWHNGFVYRSGAWDNIPVKLDRLLGMTHTIRVVEENPLAYNNAILELLNRFGVTP
ncbi:MAG: toll/interleukin-1 receptor domain-containing protein [Anaerolineae bacterium]|nr:toll/interleukin-1 receptor domain-containing protein [Anaerolineae bacterium]